MLTILLLPSLLYAVTLHHLIKLSTSQQCGFSNYHINPVDSSESKCKLVCYDASGCIAAYSPPGCGCDQSCIEILKDGNRYSQGVHTVTHTVENGGGICTDKASAVYRNNDFGWPYNTALFSGTHFAFPHYRGTFTCSFHSVGKDTLVSVRTNDNVADVTIFPVMQYNSTEVTGLVLSENVMRIFSPEPIVVGCSIQNYNSIRHIIRVQPLDRSGVIYGWISNLLYLTQVHCDTIDIIQPLNVACERSNNQPCPDWHNSEIISMTEEDNVLYRGPAQRYSASEGTCIAGITSRDGNEDIGATMLLSEQYFSTLFIIPNEPETLSILSKSSQEVTCDITLRNSTTVSYKTTGQNARLKKFSREISEDGWAGALIECTEPVNIVVNIQTIEMNLLGANTGPNMQLFAERQCLDTESSLCSYPFYSIMPFKTKDTSIVATCFHKNGCNLLYSPSGCGCHTDCARYLRKIWRGVTIVDNVIEPESAICSDNQVRIYQNTPEALEYPSGSIAGTIFALPRARLGFTCAIHAMETEAMVSIAARSLSSPLKVLVPSYETIMYSPTGIDDETRVVFTSDNPIIVACWVGNDLDYYSALVPITAEPVYGWISKSLRFMVGDCQFQNDEPDENTTCIMANGMDCPTQVFDQDNQVRLFVSDNEAYSGPGTKLQPTPDRCIIAINDDNTDGRKPQATPYVTESYFSKVFFIPADIERLSALSISNNDATCTVTFADGSTDTFLTEGVEANLKDFHLNAAAGYAGATLECTDPVLIVAAFNGIGQVLFGELSNTTWSLLRDSTCPKPTIEKCNYPYYNANPFIGLLPSVTFACLDSEGCNVLYSPSGCGCDTSCATALTNIPFGKNQINFEIQYGGALCSDKPSTVTIPLLEDWQFLPASLAGRRFSTFKTEENSICSIHAQEADAIVEYTVHTTSASDNKNIPKFTTEAFTFNELASSISFVSDEPILVACWETNGKFTLLQPITIEPVYGWISTTLTAIPSTCDTAEFQTSSQETCEASDQSACGTRSQKPGGYIEYSDGTALYQGPGYKITPVNECLTAFASSNYNNNDGTFGFRRAVFLEEKYFSTTYILPNQADTLSVLSVNNTNVWCYLKTTEENFFTLKFFTTGDATNIKVHSEVLPEGQYDGAKMVCSGPVLAVYTLNSIERTMIGLQNDAIWSDFKNVQCGNTRSSVPTPAPTVKPAKTSPPSASDTSGVSKLFDKNMLVHVLSFGLLGVFQNLQA